MLAQETVHKLLFMLHFIVSASELHLEELCSV